MANTDLIARVYPSSHDHLARHAAKAIIDSSYYVSPLYEEPEEKIQYGRDDHERTEPPDEPGDRKPSEFDGKPFIEIQFSEARDPRVEFNLDVAAPFLEPKLPITAKGLNVSNGEEHALKQPSQKAVIDSDKWLEEADTLNPYPQLCLEYIPGGSLDKCEKITVTESVSVLRQILSALVDFGMHGRGELLRTICGTEPYAPPEIWEPYVKKVQPTRYSPAVDIRSLGIVVYELLLGFPRYQQYWDQPPRAVVAIASLKRRLTWCEWIIQCLYEEYRKKPNALKQLLISSMLHLSLNARDSARECYRKAMALPQMILENNTVPHGGILWREDTIVCSSTNTGDNSTIQNEALIGEHSTSQNNYLGLSLRLCMTSTNYVAQFLLQ
ncbi:calcium/calmodulin-dependent protein kinase [Metarhizium acridum CQMa 102]|uniref:Calcium/calmodulin-dependent protein kinase n=1 Tax=Metarhizium acridum (strain CQMa 102) TaxID=655827 RepID=E9EAM3_METAQ|nr:calcium/calmodulin-dependent protein kinase [Metarhizium acridum CQMa 102]EFY87023.1 calcium/calmodulin-dependent protein kinase [Metarhizium acridum CQMa 102]